MSTPTRLEVLTGAALIAVLYGRHKPAEHLMRLAELTILDEGQNQP